MNNVARTWDEATEFTKTPMYLEGTPLQIPLMTHMLFQGMFFIITPGAYLWCLCGANEVQHDGGV